MTPANELGELYAEHARCLEANAIGCEAIWEEIEERERRAANREDERACPAGSVSVGYANDSETCVSQSQARTLLRNMMR